MDKGCLKCYWYNPHARTSTPICDKGIPCIFRPANPMVETDIHKPMTSYDKELQSHLDNGWVIVGRWYREGASMVQLEKRTK